MPASLPGGAALRLARTVAEGLLRLAYPARCLGCDAVVDPAEGPVCPRCLLRPERVDPGDVATRLARLPAEARHLDGGFALWHFEQGGLLQDLQHALKYGNRPRLGLYLGARMGDALKTALPAGEAPDLLVPVPLHPVRYLERGYNQSTMLARGTARVLRVDLADGVLVRERMTRTQTALGRSDRWANVGGAFAVRAAERVRGARLLLVDDVLTTGATASAAAQALKAAGAASVHVAALALVGA